MCKHSTTSYYITQVLTGHGSFGTFTKRIRKTEDDTCKTCGQMDDPAHVLYECVRWGEERTRLKEQLGCDLPTATEIIGKMLEDKKTWNAVTTYMTVVMTNKEKEDRNTQG
ncbi:uncharacterized protein LOC130902979 [Diorhabda carinulata]|uniref:uncharacterized protein LOC130902979 n=1 Tax=Diorhabda carinulata TaxID=1163345 RepID=UPI0025A0E757|nr:uncharacterized protein LOC130902979 [Diorhabda carinulata]